MMLVNDWLSGCNLSDSPVVERLEGEALTYALVTYMVRPERIPDEVVVALAESFFTRYVQDSESH